jgi:hypothetical protein
MSFLIISILAALSGCTSSRSITSLNNELYFKESPKIIVIEDSYYLRFIYSDTQNANGFAMFTESKIINDSLIFYLPVTTSSFNRKGMTQFEEIITKNKIEIIKNGKVFWKNPDESIIHMEIQQSKEGINIMEKKIVRKAH